MIRPLALALLVIALPAFALADSGDEDNLDLARAAVERGEILPLAEAVKELLIRHPGRLIEVEFEHDGRDIYEVELVTEDGRLMDAEVDAKTGMILEVEEDD